MKLIPKLLRPVQSSTHFSTLLTHLFESLALILSQHQPVVEKYYGTTPKTLRLPSSSSPSFTDTESVNAMTFVTSCLLSECDQIGLKILGNWKEERGVVKKLKELRIGAGAQGQGQGVRQGEEQDTRNEVREVDALVGELAVMSGRWQLLRRFLYSRLRVSSSFSFFIQLLDLLIFLSTSQPLSGHGRR